jgi:hypothetical protein
MRVYYVGGWKRQAANTVSAWPASLSGRTLLAKTMFAAFKFVQKILNIMIICKAMNDIKVPDGKTLFRAINGPSTKAPGPTQHAQR